MMKLHILGCGSASPTPRHKNACQVLEADSRLMMIDCGEGAAHSMARMGLRTSRLDHIFLSHLHADHCMGLFGVINALAMNGRRKPLMVHTFAEGEVFFRGIIDFFCHTLPFPLHFNIIVPGERATLLSAPTPGGGALQVRAIPLRHRVADTGFLVSYTDPKGHEATYAYCSDTAYFAELADEVRGVDLLYHEATYAADRADRAPLHYHSTAEQAALIARAAGAGALLLGHFASSYRNEEEHLAQARAIFTPTLAANEGLTLDIPLDD